MLKVFLSGVILLLLLHFTLSAQVPQLINYQGKLSDKSENPITGSRAITFRIYNSITGGSAIWSENHTVTLSEGYFSVILGSINPIPFAVFDGNDKYLSLQIGSDTEMSPRTRLVSVGYAFRTQNADKVDGKDASAFIQSLEGVTPGSSGNIDLVAGSNITITPNAVNNRITIAATGGGQVQVPLNLSGTHTEPIIKGTNTGDGQAVHGVHSRSGNYGYLGGKDFGTYGLSNHIGIYGSGRTYGISGVQQPSGNYGHLGRNDYGVYGQHAASRNLGYLGSNTFGVYGEHFGSENYGYLGGETYGVYGYGTSGEGLQNSKNSRTSAFNAVENFGIYGEHYNQKFGYIAGVHYAVYGQNQNYYGFIGGASQGVFGKGGGKSGYIGGNRYAGYFSGDVHVDGILTAYYKQFKIDHPLEPDQKYLNHYCVESDELANIYSGNVIADAQGEALVELPAWFEGVNTDIRYHLTCIGGYAPVYVAEEMNNNRFKIAGAKPGMKISWQVTGVRNDAYARAHPRVVEEEKIGDERGKYLTPEVHGQPSSLQVHYEELKQIEETARQTNTDRQRRREQSQQERFQQRQRLEQEFQQMNSLK